MKNWLSDNQTLLLAITLVVLAFGVYPKATRAEQNNLSNKAALNAVRTCTPEPDTATQTVTSTGTSAAPAQLDADTVYLVRCTTETYMDMGTSAVTAVGTDFAYLPGVFPIRASTTVDYIGFLAKDDAGICYMQACQ